MSKTFLPTLSFIQISTTLTSFPEYIELIYQLCREGNFKLCEPFTLLIMIQSMAANSDAGYWIKWNKSIQFVLMNNTSIELDNIDMIVKTAVKAGVFDKKIFDEEQVLTGEYMQDSYFSAIIRLRRIVQNEGFLRYMTIRSREEYYDQLVKKDRTFNMSSSNHDPAGKSINVTDKPINVADKPINVADKSINVAVENGREYEKKRTEGEGNLRAHARDTDEEVVLFKIRPDHEWMPGNQREKLQKDAMALFAKIKSMPCWSNKSKEALEEAEKKVRRLFYCNPYLPCIVLKNLIQKDMGYICDPTESEMRSANNALKIYSEKLNMAKGNDLNYIPYEALEENGMLAFKQEWDRVIEKMPDDLVADAKQTKFKKDLEANKERVDARRVLLEKKVGDWMMDNIELVFNVTGGKTYYKLGELC